MTAGTLADHLCSDVDRKTYAIAEAIPVTQLVLHGAGVRRVYAETVADPEVIRASTLDFLDSRYKQIIIDEQEKDHRGMTRWRTVPLHLNGVRSRHDAVDQVVQQLQNFEAVTWRTQAAYAGSTDFQVEMGRTMGYGGHIIATAPEHHYFFQVHSNASHDNGMKTCLTEHEVAYIAALHHGRPSPQRKGSVGSRFARALSGIKLF
jgi:hypothetical protein